ncbi:MAG: hypothetical protein WC781_02390 [Candidatus Pacearchaeota archaeon]|jgi:hypothetical protein
MFKSRCPRCDKKVGNKFDFCPFCGVRVNLRQEDYGLIGKEDSETFEPMPLGLNGIFNSLMNELNKQMSELDRELKNAPIKKEVPIKSNFSSFSIHISSPGQKPIKISNISNLPKNNIEINPLIVGQPTKSVEIPKIDRDLLINSKSLPRKEAETNVRRLSDKIVYEISVPGVKSIKKINMNLLENGIEIKALADNAIYFKDLNVKLPLINYYLQDETLFLELALK